MATEVSIALIVTFSTLAGTGIGAFVTYKIEQRRQKWELERQKLAWRREDRLNNLNPVRQFLDKTVAVIHKYGEWKKTAFIIRAPSGARRGLETELRTELLNLFREEGSVVDTTFDPKLRLLLIDIIFISGLPDWQMTDKYRQLIQEAYRKIEELATEF